MSARQITENQNIPSKKIYFHDVSDLPSHYSETPGGTLYSTTPGGTKIVYERAFLMNLRNSPISKTPPTCGIPDSLLKGNNQFSKPANNKLPRKPLPKRNTGKKIEDEEQFPIDI